MHHMPIRRLIRERYAAVHGAVPTVDYPHHCTIHEGDAAVATLGYRRGSEGRLFVEAYLDRPIEILLSCHFSRTVDRTAVVEIGAHASRRPFATLALWARAAEELEGKAEFAVAVLTRPLREMFQRVGMPLEAIAPASPGLVAHGSGEWGRYYDSDPLVCVGEVAVGKTCLAQWAGEAQA